LVRALHIADEEGFRSKGGAYKGKIYIGQGYQGKNIDGLGIGRCCAGAKRCVKGCPPTASAILEELRRTND
jgi:hypothetical protein